MTKGKNKSYSVKLGVMKQAKNEDELNMEHGMIGKGQAIRAEGVVKGERL